MLSRHLEGDLADATCAEMMAHVERCPRCRTACDSLRRVLALCRDAPVSPPPAALGSAVRDAIRMLSSATQQRSGRRQPARER
jgi:RNA polymerase sigma-70 factor (ECF subfamily)